MDEIFTFGKIGIVLLFLGLIVAFSPTIVFTELAVILKSKRPILASIALIAGVGVALISLVIISIIIFNPSQQIDIPSTREVLKLVPLLDIVAGILLIWGSRRYSVNKQTKSGTSGNVLGPKSLFWFGLIKMLTSLSTLGAIIIAVRLLETHVASGFWLIIATAWLLIVAMLPFVILVLIKLFKPEKLIKLENASKKMDTINWRQLFSKLMLWLGILLIVYGLFSL
jgi:hypothetical protein